MHHVSFRPVGSLTDDRGSDIHPDHLGGEEWIPSNISIGIFQRRFRRVYVIICALCLLSGSASAQWVSESYPLKAGWSAIWLSIDTPQGDIDSLLSGHPAIEEIWRWNPASSTTQFTQTPAGPLPAPAGPCWPGGGCGSGATAAARSDRSADSAVQLQRFHLRSLVPRHLRSRLGQHGAPGRLHRNSLWPAGATDCTPSYPPDRAPGDAGVGNGIS